MINTKIFPYPLVFFLAGDLGKEVTMATVFKFNDETIWVFEEVIHRHVIYCADWVIFSLKD